MLKDQSSSTNRLRVSALALQNNKMLVLTRKEHQLIVLELPNTDYLVVRFEPALDSKHANCGIYWPKTSVQNYQQCTQAIQGGLQILVDASLCLEIKGRHDIWYGARILISAPRSVLVTRWEILVKKKPELTKKIRKDLPHLFHRA